MPRTVNSYDYKNIEIALTLSGGGYRASIFHIGVLSYLYHLKLSDGSRLLDHITVMSTVSGGTITGMLYLLSLIGDKSIPKYLNDIYKKIIGNNLANDLLLNIKKNRKSRKLSIIKELGNVYDSVFFKGKKLDLLYNVMQNSHVHHYAAYATDISNALPFRFQVAKSEYGDATIGNEVKRIDIDEAKEYRLADILAASSCFPIAFEPINIPRDFNNISIDDEYAQSNMQTLLMDGGIIDNQGVDYLLEASKHMEIINKRGIDLAIISDAAASIGDQYQNVKESHIGKFAFILNLSLKIKKCIFEKLLSLTIIGLQVRLFVIGIFFWGISYFVNEICREVFLVGFITSICFFLFICWLKRITPREMKKMGSITNRVGSIPYIVPSLLSLHYGKY